MSLQDQALQKKLGFSSFNVGDWGRNYLNSPTAQDWAKKNLFGPTPGPTARAAPGAPGSSKLPALNTGVGTKEWGNEIWSNLPPLYASPYPAHAGLPYLHQAIANYKDIPGAEGRLAGNLESTELKYNQAENMARESSYASGAAGSGVQNLARAALPVARAGEQAGNLYEQETWLAEQQMNKLVSLLFPWISSYNQAFGTARGKSLPSTGSGFEDWMAAAQSILGSLESSGWISGGKNKKAGPTSDWPDWAG